MSKEICMLKGKGVSSGIGFGKVVTLKKNEIKVTKNKVSDVDHEINYFYDCYNKLIEETKELVNRLSGTEKDIMEAYLMIMQDPTLLEQTLSLIKDEKYNVVYATEVGFDSVIDMFKAIDDPYMSARSSDIEDIKNKLLGKLLKVEMVDLMNLPKDTIVVSEELTTSDTAKLNFENVSGIISSVGGANSHVSIMARTRAIPAVVGIKDVFNSFKNGDFVAVNGQTGEVFVNPSEDELEKLKVKRDSFEKEKLELEEFRDKESVTLDGAKLELVCNIGVPDDVDMVKLSSAEGIGLFRSEFLYMDSEEMPTEEEQFESYKRVAQQMGDKLVIIRTLDIGGDKDIKSFKLEKEANPFLGYRAIRICLREVTMFKTQLRAILRASAFGNLAIMFPMISSIEELRKAKEILEEVKVDLKNENISFKEDIKVGIMIEIPSAAVIAEHLAKECDFFSIGTNDLIQYTVAVERGNEKIANLYDKYNPAVIRLIKSAIDGAHKAGIFCGMCGEAAGDEKYIPLLVGLGLDEFSMNPNSILKARKIIRNLKKSDCEKLANEILNLSSSEEIRGHLGTGPNRPVPQ